VESTSADNARQLADLEIEERTVSSRRRRVQDRLDFMRSGAAVPSPDHEEKLRSLEEEERELSTRRRDLHLQIDALRVKLGQQPGPRPRPRQLGG
jgi:hypothetical protein